MRALLIDVAPGQSKIDRVASGNLARLKAEGKIGRFDVAVEVAVLVQALDSTDHLTTEESHLREGKRSDGEAPFFLVLWLCGNRSWCCNHRRRRRTSCGWLPASRGNGGLLFGVLVLDLVEKLGLSVRAEVLGEVIR
jgi:hypothetical protein